MNHHHEPDYYQAVHVWSSPLTSVRLSMALIFFALFVLPLPTPEKSQLLWLAAQQLVFGVVVLVTQQYLPPRVSGEMRALFISLAMIVFVSSVAITMRAEAAAMLLFLPVINAALRTGPRSLWVITGLTAVVWLYIHSVNRIPDPWLWSDVVVGLGPLVIVAWVMHQLRGDNDLVQQRLTTLSHQDELTGTLNMKAFTRLLMAEHARAQQAQLSYALLMVDIRHLQAINEKHGHEQGNKVVVAIAEALRRSIRSNDLLARYGGDEFIVYVAGADDEIAQAVSNRIGQNVYNITLSFERGTERVEVNTGVAIYPDSGATVQDMMGFADKAMYREKEFRQRARPDSGSSNIGRQQAGLEPR